MGKQLEVTQELFKDNLTIISISNESEPVVQNFIDSHHPRLTIAIDADNQTFNNFHVDKSLPYSVLLNQKGKVLWKGHPADLSNVMIRNFIKNNRHNPGKEIPDFITIADQKSNGAENTDTNEFSVKRIDSDESFFISNQDGIHFIGKISKIISEILKKSCHDIRVLEDSTIEVSIGSDYMDMERNSLLEMLLDKLGLAMNIVEEEGDYYNISVINPDQLWDDEQISLGSNDGAYIINDQELTLDNATVQDFSFRLSELLGSPVYTNSISDIKHDWLVHYKYWAIMKEVLSSEYGLQIEKIRGQHKVFLFRKLF